MRRKNLVYDACANVSSVNLNKSIALFGHDTNFKSGNTFDLIISLAKAFICACKVKRNIAKFDRYKNYLGKKNEVCKYSAIVTSYYKFTKGWHFYRTLTGT